MSIENNNLKENENNTENNEGKNVQNSEEKVDSNKDSENNSENKTDIRTMFTIIFIGLIWTLCCFFAWIISMFAGFGYENMEEYIMKEPFNARLAQVIQCAIPIVWLVVPILFILNTDKKSKKD